MLRAICADLQTGAKPAVSLAVTQTGNMCPHEAVYLGCVGLQDEMEAMVARHEERARAWEARLEKQEAGLQERLSSAQVRFANLVCADV